MPIYEYECESCKTRSEALQKFDDPPLTTCEKCGGHLRRLISAPAFQFKGSGWYVTDYGGKSGASAPASGKSDSSGAETSSKQSDKPGGSSSSKPDSTKS
ncbi:MAG TPA: FmdB family zinc ribbon protein [Thermoanaerobaculia bacterium]|nr:FmdB family zinc ribbon protein [Thermoanaerobaculia bacterium]